MRIISGTSRGTKLYTLDGLNTRPTLDRVKEPLFSIITNFLVDAEILDLFSGSGALALEALSRGAYKAVACDSSKEAINIIKKNMEKTHLDLELYNMDFENCLNKLSGRKFDIIFLDPPYNTDYIYKSVSAIINNNLLKENGIIIAETDNKKVINEIEKLDIEIKDIRKYGRAILVFLNRKG